MEKVTDFPCSYVYAKQKDGISTFQTTLSHRIEYAKTLKLYGVSKTEKNVSVIQPAWNSIAQRKLSDKIQQEALENLNLPLTDDIIKAKLGKYACENSAEFLAEAYSYWNPNQLAQEVIRLLLKL